MRRLTILALLCALGFAASAAAGAHHRYPHHPECNRPACARNADRAFARAHRPTFHFTAFELCVANRESGNGTDTLGTGRYATINWRYEDGTYEGAYNWLNSTWISMGGLRYAARAVDATPREQTLIFRAHAHERGQWPQTVPACGG